jgi:DNA-binding NarL/FixJ family response regulator
MDRLRSSFQEISRSLDSLVEHDELSPSIRQELRKIRVSLSELESEWASKGSSKPFDNYSLHQFSITPAELRVYQELVNGLLTREIAKKLRLSEATVKSHIQAIYQKIGVRNRAESISKGLEIGLRKI